MMKSITATALIFAAGTAFANAYTVTLDANSYTNPNRWAYVWTNAGDTGSYDTSSNWGILKTANEQSLTAPTNNKPVSSDPAFIGYDFAYTDGKQVLTSNDKTLNIAFPSKSGNATNMIYLGDNVTLSGNDNLFSSDHTTTFNFGDFGGTSVISMGAFWKQNGTINFAGNVVMTGNSFSYTLFKSTKLDQNEGTWNASNVSVTDAAGNALKYAEKGSENIGKAGYYWLLETGDKTVSTNQKGGNYKLELVALSVPEPSAFGLLAGLGALALVASRRRRSRK